MRFLQTAFPEFRVRGEGISQEGTRWVHVGTDETYIALSQSSVEPAKSWTPYEGLPGINHLTYEVDDFDGPRHRMSSAGYTDSTPTEAHSYLDELPIVALRIAEILCFSQCNLETQLSPTFTVAANAVPKGRKILAQLGIAVN